MSIFAFHFHTVRIVQCLLYYMCIFYREQRLLKEVTQLKNILFKILASVNDLFLLLLSL